MGLLRWFQQVLSVTRFSVLTIPQRLGSSAAAALGIGGVVLVLVGVLSIARGFRHAMTVSGSEEVAIVLRSGANTEMMSGLSRQDTTVVEQAPGIARDADGPLASAELFVVIDLPKRSTGTSANVPLRGVQENAFDIRERLEIVEGRMFEWGRNEVIVGEGAAVEFSGLEVGNRIPVGGQMWEVVGRFTAGGGISESEIWTDARLLQSAYRRGDSFQAVYARLESPEAYPRFEEALADDPRISVDAARQTDYYAEQSVIISNLITGLGTLVAVLMGIGALFGALNTMYTAVSSRTREIATLRALGFTAGPVVLSVLAESLLLALAGGALGGALGYLVFNGFRAATMNWASFSQVTFAFQVTPGLLLQGILYAALIGLGGGLLPAIRAARLPVATALREP